jgi:hypothetical protein
VGDQARVHADAAHCGRPTDQILYSLPRCSISTRCST